MIPQGPSSPPKPAGPAVTLVCLLVVIAAAVASGAIALLTNDKSEAQGPVPGMPSGPVSNGPGRNSSGNTHSALTPSALLAQVPGPPGGQPVASYGPVEPVASQRFYLTDASLDAVHTFYVATLAKYGITVNDVPGGPGTTTDGNGRTIGYDDGGVIKASTGIVVLSVQMNENYLGTHPGTVFVQVSAH